ncbi:MAG: hypothetical protein NT159_09265 [Proteobacteria bacterium]|nr:hypothetical protein [Pseudomonadota bacterium]
MHTALKTRRQTQWTAATLATLATLFTMGGPLTLAEHYAQTGAKWSTSGYYAVGNARRIACPADREAKTAELAALSGAEA